jgi:hypothetical protein
MSTSTGRIDYNGREGRNRGGSKTGPEKITATSFSK